MGATRCALDVRLMLCYVQNCLRLTCGQSAEGQWRVRTGNFLVISKSILGGARRLGFHGFEATAGEGVRSIEDSCEAQF
jgi:hypothetical protein